MRSVDYRIAWLQTVPAPSKRESHPVVSSRQVAFKRSSNVHCVRTHRLRGGDEFTAPMSVEDVVRIVLGEVLGTGNRFALREPNRTLPQPPALRH